MLAVMPVKSVLRSYGGLLFDACAAGRLLILSPWPYDGGKRHISRADCVALNAMAEEICNYQSLRSA